MPDALSSCGLKQEPTATQGPAWRRLSKATEALGAAWVL